MELSPQQFLRQGFEHFGWGGFIDKMKVEAPRWAQTVPTLPRLFASWLEADIEAKKMNPYAEIEKLLAKQLEYSRRWKYFAMFLSGVLLTICVFTIFIVSI